MAIKIVFLYWCFLYAVRWMRIGVLFWESKMQKIKFKCTLKKLQSIIMKEQTLEVIYYHFYYVIFRTTKSLENMKPINYFLHFWKNLPFVPLCCKLKKIFITFICLLRSNSQQTNIQDGVSLVFSDYCFSQILFDFIFKLVWHFSAKHKPLFEFSLFHKPNYF